jgi:uncharacterized cupin superfamily protein
MKPVINLDELEMQGDAASGSYGVICERIGARRLGYNFTILPPGRTSSPFHNHRINEEMFFIVEGEGTLRFGENEYPVRPHDVIACPTGGRDVAHQLKNTGETDLKYLALSTKADHEIAEFPDSDKITVMDGDFGDVRLSHAFRVKDAVDYFDGEEK